MALAIWKILLFFCLCSRGLCCNSGWYHYSGKCYKPSQNVYIYTLAIRYCQVAGGTLADINSTDLLQSISSIPEFNSINEYWVGMDSLITETTTTISPTTHETSHDHEREEDHGHDHDHSSQDEHLTIQLCPYAKILKIDYEYCSEKKHFLCENRYPDNPDICPTGFDYYGSHCYRAVKSIQANYEDAVKFCTLQKSKLATLETEEKEWEAKSVLLGEKDIFLVAARKYDGVLKWSNDVLFSPIHDLFANYSDGDCVGFLSEPEHPLVFSWAHTECEQTHYFLCETDPLTSTSKPPEATTAGPTTTTVEPVTCPHGYNWKSDEDSGYCFWETTYETDRLNWFQARDFCKLFGGDLASYSTEEQERIGLGGARGHFRGLWIGLKRDENDVFHWVDGNTLNFTNWNTNEPNLKSNTKYCVTHSSGTSQWELDYCGVRRWFICRAPKVKGALMPNIPSIKKTSCDIKGVSIYSSQWYQYEDHCYLIQEKGEYTWDTAQLFCQDNGGHMVSFHSFEETNFILSSISGYPNSNFWIGLNAHGLHSSYEWTDNTALDFIYWSDNKSEPKDFNSCVDFNKRDGSWDINHCNRLQGVICKRGINATYDFTSTEPTVVMPGNCENGWYNFGNNCFKFFGTLWSQRLSWNLAKKECDSLGADLVSIHNQEEQDFLTDVLLEATTDVWIGLRAIEKGTIYHWSDSTRMDYTNWKPNEPQFHLDMDLYMGSTNLCVEMEYGDPSTMGKWNDLSCADTKGYICQKMKDPTNTKLYHDPFTCPNITGWYKLGASCYGLFDQYNMTWLDAQAECRKYGANLITYKNVAVSIYVQRRLKLKNIKNTYFWIGMREKSPEKYEYVTGRTLLYDNWMSGQPRAASSLLDNCVATTGEGLWLVKSCKEKHPFLCETKSDASEPEPKIDRTHACRNLTGDWYDFGTDYCYLYETDLRLSWVDAMHYCFKHGGYLASFHSADEISKFSKNLLYFNKPPSLHIGLGKKKDGSYGWVDNSPVDFTSWDEGEPDGDKECVEMNMKNSKWNDIDCESNYRGFVCSSPKLSSSYAGDALAINTTLEMDIIKKKLTVGGILGIVICVAVILSIIGVTVYYLRPTKQIQPRLLDSDAL